MIIALNLSLHNQEMERKVETAKLKKERNCRATLKHFVESELQPSAPLAVTKTSITTRLMTLTFTTLTARKRAAHVLSWSATKKAHVLSFSS